MPACEASHNVNHLQRNGKISSLMRAVFSWPFSLNVVPHLFNRMSSDDTVIQERDTSTASATRALPCTPGLSGSMGRPACCFVELMDTAKLEVDKLKLNTSSVQPIMNKMVLLAASATGDRLIRLVVGCPHSLHVVHIDFCEDSSRKTVSPNCALRPTCFYLWFLRRMLPQRPAQSALCMRVPDRTPTSRTSGLQRSG